jgi:hypothetical protein
MNYFLVGAVASGGHKAVQVSFGDHRLPLHWVGLGMLIATIVTWLIFRWRGARLKRRLNSPRQLLRELFRLHEIGWSEQRLLLAAARRQKVKDAARLFLEPALWQHAIEAERSQLTRKRLASLQVKVLGTSGAFAPRPIDRA